MPIGLLKRLRTSTVTGIDVGSTCIRVVEAVQTSSGPRVRRFASLERWSGPLDDLDPELPDRLRELWNYHRFSKVVCAVFPAEHALIRRFQMPRLPAAEMDRAVAIEAENRLPSTGKPLVSDHVILPARDAGQCDVVLVGAESGMLQGLVDALLRARLRPLAVDLSLVAAHRALVAGYKIDARPGEWVLLADFGADGTRLGMFCGAALEWVRTLPPLPAASAAAGNAGGGKPSPEPRPESQEAVFGAIASTLEAHLLKTKSQALRAIYALPNGTTSAGVAEDLHAYLEDSLAGQFPALSGLRVQALGPGAFLPEYGAAAFESFDMSYIGALGASLWKA